MPCIVTLNTSHLGDGVYVGLDAAGLSQIWLGANDHRNMAVALGPGELRALLEWVKKNAPHVAKGAGLN
jgi:hypothetical protein